MTATPHDHRTHVLGCFRCELSADEVTATPARDGLRHLLVDYYANADLLDHEVIDLTVEALLCPDEHDVVVAALVESGWKVTADQLRAMGGRQVGWWYDESADGEPGLRWSSNVARPPSWPSATNVRPAFDFGPEGVDGD